MTIWFKYTKTSTTEKKLERIKKEQARDTINHWESEWWDEYGSASQSDFTAGCLYLHIHLHICLHSTLQKKDRCVRSQYMHKHTRHLFTNLTDVHASITAPVYSWKPSMLVTYLIGCFVYGFVLSQWVHLSCGIFILIFFMYQISVEQRLE